MVYIYIYLWFTYIYYIYIQYHWVLPFYLLIVSPFFHPNSVHRFVSSRCPTDTARASPLGRSIVSYPPPGRSARCVALRTSCAPEEPVKKDGSWGWATGEAGGELRKWKSNSIYIYSIYI